MVKVSVERICKDSNFKETFCISQMKKINNFTVKSSNNNLVYQPDLVFYSESKSVFIEQSSNYTKKIHIAEFLQFAECVKSKRLFEYKGIDYSDNMKFSYILILTPKDEKKLKKENEANRLKFYWDNILSELEYSSKIEFIGVCNYNDIKGNTDFEYIKSKCKEVYKKKEN